METSGLLVAQRPEKKKQGYLYLWKPTKTSWKKYYFLLFKKSLAYYSLEEKKYPKGVIDLASINSIRLLKTVPKSEGKQEDKEDEEKDQQTRSFVLTTPIRVLKLKAKHPTAMVDWILAIQDLKKDGGDVVSRELGVDIKGTPINLNKEKIRLEYEDNAKKKIFKMKKNQAMIGRSSKADVSLLDKKVSRNHARIELNLSGIPVISFKYENS